MEWDVENAKELKRKKREWTARQPVIISQPPKPPTLLLK
jgi:hypothetical protein